MHSTQPWTSGGTLSNNVFISGAQVNSSWRYRSEAAEGGMYGLVLGLLLAVAGLVAMLAQGADDQ